MEKVEIYCEASVERVESIVQANTGNMIMRINGVAFHEGINKNNWEISNEMGQSLVSQMIGMDLTLNHPQPDAFGFSRNMDGNVDEAVVGIVTEASFHQLNSGWEVRYVAEVYRSELFEALDSGLWLRGDYGVSIGGFGVPTHVDEETGYALFADDFTLDHLAIVHRPAYPRANIEEAEAILAEQAQIIEVSKEITKQPEAIELSASEINLKYSNGVGKDNEGCESMTDEEITQTEVEPIMDNSAEVEELKANLILANATIEQFKAAEEAKAEEARMELVKEASKKGLRGHEDLSSEVISSLIASWNAANPPVEEKVFEAVTQNPEAVETVEAASQPKVVVANYFNGTIVESNESLYARAYNAWASAYNGVAGGDERAQMYEEINNTYWLNRRVN
ncbi:MAG: hypothetical protein HOC79_08900 [Euryarchaeota archaeon]|nr:hypothetical protein [Euryarchaeota archaeon]